MLQTDHTSANAIGCTETHHNPSISMCYSRFVRNVQPNQYLVGGFNPPDKYESVGMIIPNIWENNSHVPNHQPDTHAQIP